MIQHLPILPIILPLLTGALLLWRCDMALGRQRMIACGSVLAVLLSTLVLHQQAAEGRHLVYAIGGWQAPFGIVLLLDRLSALMLVLAASLALLCVISASRGEDSNGAHFHALFQFQLMGIMGAFLTGDLFNLFVFFEILLIASYALLLHGGGRARSRAGLHYVLLNLIGSALFLLALGMLYGLLGTLNMADLAVRVRAMPEAEQPLVHGAAMILLVVFGIKSAMLPLLFWLPRAYAAASPAVAALFAIMTKVGIYAILRVFILIFDVGNQSDHSFWLLLWPLALATLLLGSAGALGAHSLRGLAAYMVIASSGTLLATIALASEQAVAAALFYLLHTTFMAACFFLLTGVISSQRGAFRDMLIPGPPIDRRWLTGGIFFIAATSMAGLPPLSGFVSKIWILQTAPDGYQALWLWSVLLTGGVMSLIAFGRAGSTLFWRQEQPASGKPASADPLQLLVIITLLLISALMTIYAEALMQIVSLASAQLFDHDSYIRAVLATDATGLAP